MASRTASSTAPHYRSNKKPPILPPTSVSSSRGIPPPIPKKHSKSSNYYRVSGKMRSVSSPSAALCSAVDFKPAAVVGDGSDDYCQDPDKVQSNQIKGQ